jgi:hypothetical protein
MASFLKRKFGSNLWGFVSVIVFLGAVVALEYFEIFSFYNVSKTVFNFVVLKSFGLIVPVLAVIGAYSLNRWFFAQNYYAETFEKKTTTAKSYNASNLSFLNRFGAIGEIIALEMKLIWRHKRSKNVLYMAAFFLFYGLLFYTNDIYANSYSWVFFCAMFITGLLMLLYGQWIIGWNSSHFDSLMTRNLSIRSYLTANVYLMLAGNVACFLLTTPYFLFGKTIAIAHIAAFLYNSGVNALLLTYFATYNTKRIDLSIRSAMNYQGTTFKNFLIVIPMMFFPMIIVGIFALFSKANTALVILAILGVLGLVFQKQLITMCVNQFNKRKYILCEGFRQTE